MKVTKEKAKDNRERILVAAARLFRERGLSGVGVDALTEAAGLTYGSVYSQFGSKDRLMAETLSEGFARTEPIAARIDSLEQLLTQYLSVQHRDNPGAGCYMATLGAEMPRQTLGVRHSFTEIVTGNIARISKLLPKREASREAAAIAAVATMVGAMVLARAVDDAHLSEKILEVARNRLLET